MLRSLLSRSLCALSVALLASSSVVHAQEPSIYITFHGGKNGINSVYSYDLSGNPILSGVTSGDDNANGLRSAIIRDDGTLLVCNANKESSRLVIYSTCGSDGTRTYVDDFADDSHLSHPYGLTQGLDDETGETSVWATNQDTFDLVQYGADGTFQQQVKQFGQDELRSVVYDSTTGVIYVADETQDAVLAYDEKTQTWDSTLDFGNITDPIGLFIDTDAYIIYIGSNNSPSYVYAYDLATGELVQSYTDPNLQHPAGMVTYGDSLYVISQSAGTLMQFNTTTGDLIGTPISSFPDTPEQILLSDC